MDRSRVEEDAPVAKTGFGAFLQDRAAKPSDRRRWTPDVLKRYGVALGLAGLALLLRGVLPFAEGTAIYQLPLVAVLLSAWYGGRGPGLLASVTCATVILYRFIPPADSFALSADHALGFFFFIALCLLVTQFSAGRRRAEQALRASEERFRALVQFSFDVYWESDAQHRFTRQEFSERLTDAPRAGSELGKTRWEIPYLEPDEEAWRQHRATMEAHQPFRDFELARPTPDGGKRYVSVSGMPVFDASGTFLGYRGVGRHITDRKRLEELLAGEKRILEMLARGVALAEVLDSLCRLVEKQAPGALASVLLVEGSRLRHGAAPNLPKAYIQAIDGLVIGPGAGACGTAAYRGEPVIVRDIEADPLWAEFRGAALPHGLRACWSTPINSPEGKVIGTFAMYYREARSPSARDQEIIERIGHLAGVAIQHRRSAEALRESEARFRKLTDLSADWYWKQDENLRFTVAMDDKVGFSALSLGRTRWELPITPLSGPWDEHRAVLAARKPFRNFEYSRIDQNGNTRYISVSGVPVFDEQGAFKGYDGVASDITLRKTAEEALRRREKELAAVIETLPVMAMVAEADGGGVLVNRRWSDYTGFRPEGENWRAAIHPEDFAAYSAARARAIATGEPFEREARWRRADGEYRWFLGRAVPLRDEHGKVMKWYGALTDIEDRKRAEEQSAAHVWFLESMDRINRAMQGTNDLDQMLGEVLDAVLEIFASDRAWLLYPCDPDAPSWKAVMERTSPQFPGAAARGRDLPMTPDAAEVARAALDSPGALPAGPGHKRQIKPQMGEHFGVRSEILMALRPKGDRPYLFGLHQCSQPRAWTREEQRLFEEIGHRLADALGSLIAVRGLRDSEQRLEAAQSVAHVGWWERDYAAGHVMLSDEACRIFGVQPVDLPHWHGRWLSLIHPDDRQKAAEASEKALRGDARYDVEYRVIRPDGVVRMVHSQGDVTRDASGRAVRQFGVLQDITELRYTERRLEAAQRLARVGWWERDFVGGRWLTSDEIARIYGIAEMDRVMDLAEWMRVVPPIIHPEDRRRVLEAAEASLRGGPRYDIEYRIVPADGTVRVVHVQADVTLDEAGRPVRQFGVAQDITELRQAEQELRARQDMLDLAQKAARAVAFDWYIGERESENYWSPELEAMYGLQAGTFDRTYRGWRKLIHPGDWPSVKLAIERANASGDIDAEYRVVHKDATVHWLQAKGRMFFDAERRPERMVGFMIDVSARRHAEEELKASESRFRTFVDHATDAFFLLDDELKIRDVNRQACESLGYTRDELIGMHPREFDVGLDEHSIARLAERIAGGETVSFETLHRRKDRMVFPVEIRVRQFLLGAKRFHLSLARDISERKLADETLREKDYALQIARTELARVSRLTTLGELTTSIAHEVSQPLGAMMASAAAGARWLAAVPPEIAEARAALQNIAADGKRARDVIGRIRALTKRQVPRKEELDINEKILQVLALTEHERRSHEIVLRTELDSTLPRVAGDRVQLQQVLLNLIVNAVEAMSAVGERPRLLTIVSRHDGANAVLVEVLDSGIGLDPARAEQVFEPFYTTKAEGIGIGLSISRSIIEAHGGRLWASANQPHGAVLRFSLPAAGGEET